MARHTSIKRNRILSILKINNLEIATGGNNDHKGGNNDRGGQRDRDGVHWDNKDKLSM
jgi:hypothetical protein